MTSCKVIQFVNVPRLHWHDELKVCKTGYYVNVFILAKRTNYYTRCSAYNNLSLNNISKVHTKNNLYK